MNIYPTPHLLRALCVGGAVVIASCGQGTSGNTNQDSTAQAGQNVANLPPVDTAKANTDYKPAFEGQTRIGGVKTETPYEGKVIAEGLSKPWGITSLPDGRLLITEKTGTMRIATTDGKLSDSITGIPKVNSNGQGGLLGLRVDPEFATNRTVYWVFSEQRPGGTLTAVAKGKLSDDEKKIEGATVIYRATPEYDGTLHYGGRILVAKDGNLIVSTGERSDLTTRPRHRTSNPASARSYVSPKTANPHQAIPGLTMPTHAPSSILTATVTYRASPSTRLPAICGRRNSVPVAVTSSTA